MADMNDMTSHIAPVREQGTAIGLHPVVPAGGPARQVETLLDVDGQQNGIGRIQEHRDLLSQQCLPVPFAAFIRQ